jgi:hypothetical protein
MLVLLVPAPGGEKLALAVSDRPPHAVTHVYMISGGRARDISTETLSVGEQATIPGVYEAIQRSAMRTTTKTITGGRPSDQKPGQGSDATGAPASRRPRVYLGRRD